MLFDTDAYVENMQNLRRIPELKAPSTKVAAINLPKLSYEKKVCNVVINVRVNKNVTVRDRFDWDLNDYKLRPVDFSSCLCESLPESVWLNKEDKQRTIKEMTNSILAQLTQHIEKNTFFPRVRFAKKEEDLVNIQGLCLNCDSRLLNPDQCIHCGFQYEKKV